jgi:phosphosulfolactate phosphohydrolase-like enzyme
MHEGRTVAIDSVSESPIRQGSCDAVVLIDVICDATTLVTSVAQGRDTYPMASAPAALSLGRQMPRPLLAADPSEAWRPGFEMPNSPAILAAEDDRRPLILACGTGTILAAHGLGWPDVYVTCFRNLAATARYLTFRHRNVLVLDAASDGDIRCEDQMVAARIARALMDVGYAPEGLGTRDTVERWAPAETSLVAWGRSAEELRAQRRSDDLDFVIARVDDLDLVCRFEDGRLSSVDSADSVPQMSITA